MRVRASAGASEEAGTARLVVRPSFGEVRCVGRGVRQRRWFGRSPWVLLRACKEVFLVWTHRKLICPHLLPLFGRTAIDARHLQGQDVQLDRHIRRRACFFLVRPVPSAQPGHPEPHQPPPLAQTIPLTPPHCCLAGRRSSGATATVRRSIDEFFVADDAADRRGVAQGPGETGEPQQTPSQSAPVGEPYTHRSRVPR